MIRFLSFFPVRSAARADGFDADVHAAFQRHRRGFTAHAMNEHRYCHARRDPAGQALA
jgi:hypothetical protein